MTWGTWVSAGPRARQGRRLRLGHHRRHRVGGGLPVTNPDGPPVPDNPYPADIVNLSLGGSGSCPSDYQDALEQVTGMGVLVIVSAGNGGAPGATAPVDTPANCSLLVPGVMARRRAAQCRHQGRLLELRLGREYRGAGRQLRADARGDCLRSIDTTTNLGDHGSGREQLHQRDRAPNLGTSFSAPIVSGIAGLMRSVNYNLTPAQLAARLEKSATAFPAGAAGVPTCPTTDPTAANALVRTTAASAAPAWSTP